LLLFSSFFTNWNGLLDSIRTYFIWLKRAGGHSPHIHPWYFYLERLAWFQQAKGPVWSEAFILVLASVGAAVAFFSNKTILARPSFARFLTFYTVILTAIYSVISYKTPWCALNFLAGMILLAGIGAAALIRLFPKTLTRVLVVAVLVAGAAHLAWEACRANQTYASDRNNPYVYAQTSPDLLKLVDRVEAIARVAPLGHETVIKIIAPESYWPLPWYLRKFTHAGWWDELPADPYAPITIVSAKLRATLDEKSNKACLMTGLYELRPGTFLELYVEIELWKKFVATLPRERE
jgi:predicted membrane-bound mannosyltransferase